MLGKDSKNMENVGYSYSKIRIIEMKVEDNIQEEIFLVT